jgi:hypothetical protein
MCYKNNTLIKMSEYYLIKSKDSYIHFNPHDKNYFTNDSKVGACGWTKEMALGFISEFSIIDATLEPAIFAKNLTVRTIKRDSQDEKNIFDDIHK